MKIFFSLLLLFASGCASYVNKHSANIQMNAGYEAIEAGDWYAAKENFGRAVRNGELANANQRDLSVAYYEYGRSSGVVCDWEGAEFGLKKSLELDRKHSGAKYFPLIELGRMYLDREDYDEALVYFSEVAPLFEEMNADTIDPLGFADFLDEYAEVIEKSDFDGQEDQYKARAAELRRTFPSGEARSERTPYGSACETS